MYSLEKQYFAAKHSEREIILLKILKTEFLNLHQQ